MNTDLGKKIYSLVSDHGEFDKDRVCQEISLFEEYDVCGDILTLHNKKNCYTNNRINSLVCYLLGITSKLPDGPLLIEKRRTYGRVGFPDIDMDFNHHRRGEIFDYLYNKYGRDRVANIGTVQRLTIKNCLHKTISVLDPEQSVIFDSAGNKVKNDTSDNFALRLKIVETLPKQPILKDGKGNVINTIEKAYEEFSDFRKMMDKYPEVYRVACHMQGGISAMGSHAAGVVVSPIPLCEISPVHLTGKIKDNEDDNDNKTIATQFTAEDVESLGLIKIDILGLLTKTVIRMTCNLIRDRHGIEINTEKIPLDDKKTFELFKNGHVDGCFQLENWGMQKTLQEIGIDSFDDLVAAIAMYRPGPMDFIPVYASRKKNPKSVSYLHPIIEKYTKNTYGIICYQEDTLISLVDGRHVPICEIKKGDIVHSYNVETKNMEPNICDGCSPTSVGDGIKIVLKNGYELLVTPEHEVWTFNGYTEAKNIKVGDLVGCPISVPDNSGEEKIAEWLGSNIHVSYLFGQLTGDGNISSGSSLSCGYEENADKILSWIEKNLPKLKCTKYKHGSWHLSVSCPILINSPDHGNRKTKWHLLLKDVGLKSNCYNKRIPDIIMMSNRQVKSAYLAGLIDSDGHISCGTNGSCICHYTSVSGMLLSDICRLLCSLGISHQRRSCRIHIWDTKSLEENISPYLVIKSFAGKRTRGKHSSFVPKCEIKKIIDHSGMSERSFCKKHNINRSGVRLKKTYCTTAIAERSGVFLGDLRYLPVIAIENVFNQQFYGMSVRNNHNLVANGIVAKNCYQEQCMNIFVEMADLTPTDGYLFIKGAAKKKAALFNSMKNKFIGNASKKTTSDIAEKVWEYFQPFSGYAFNLSHAVCYAYESWSTAYLKANFPLEFMSARLSIAAIDKDFDYIVKLEQDCEKNLNINILSPSLDDSKVNYVIVGENAIRRSLIVKGVGMNAAKEIEQKQPYRGNVIEKLGMKCGPVVNNRVIESLYDAGFFPGLKKTKVLDLFNIVRKDKKKVRGQQIGDIFS